MFCSEIGGIAVFRGDQSAARDRWFRDQLTYETAHQVAALRCAGALPNGSSGNRLLESRFFEMTVLHRTLVAHRWLGPALESWTPRGRRPKIKLCPAVGQQAGAEKPKDNVRLRWGTQLNRLRPRLASATNPRSLAAFPDCRREHLHFARRRARCARGAGSFVIQIHRGRSFVPGTLAARALREAPLAAAVFGPRSVLFEIDSSANDLRLDATRCAATRVSAAGRSTRAARPD